MFLFRFIFLIQETGKQIISWSSGYFVIGKHGIRKQQNLIICRKATFNHFHSNQELKEVDLLLVVFYVYLHFTLSYLKINVLLVKLFRNESLKINFLS